MSGREAGPYMFRVLLISFAGPGWWQQLGFADASVDFLSVSVLCRGIPLADGDRTGAGPCIGAAIFPSIQPPVRAHLPFREISAPHPPRPAGRIDAGRQSPEENGHCRNWAHGPRHGDYVGSPGLEGNHRL